MTEIAIILVAAFILFAIFAVDLALKD